MPRIDCISNSTRVMIMILFLQLLAASSRLQFASSLILPISRSSEMNRAAWQLCQSNSIRRQGEQCSPTQDMSKCERRRDVIVSSLGAASSFLLPLTYTGQANAEGYYQRLTSPKEAAEYIANFCNSEFLSSVIKSKYNFLYRGLSQDESQSVTDGKGVASIIIKDEPYDLLDPDTYQSTEAAEYFRSIEKGMIARGKTIKPSNSHLGTTCPKEAAQWGRAASIWPLGERGVEFAWLRDGGVFWPVDNMKITSKDVRRSIITSSGNKSPGKVKQDLSNALQGDAWEIMFRADDGFLAVPAELDDELRTHLMNME